MHILLATYPALIYNFVTFLWHVRRTSLKVEQKLKRRITWVWASPSSQGFANMTYLLLVRAIYHETFSSKFNRKCGQTLTPLSMSKVSSMV